MKRLLLALLCVVTMFTQTQAIELEAQASFLGEQPSGMFYYGLTKKYDLVFGVGATVPGTKYVDSVGSEFDLDLNLGLRTKLILLGVSDVYFVFDNRDGTQRSGTYEKSDFYTKSLVISKTWVYHLADQISLGVRMPIIEVMLDGQKRINFAQGLAPVLATSINF
ncbi:hypothetical protein DID80_06455 [Candidatus Marinamargulisbacteria bacterium SCGC AAA071-K20]|nr:hypothetical protein DID80_06455 [Candidatus Marinamargulisbacteria bacterium SCGC AAA071-K20]